MTPGIRIRIGAAKGERHVSGLRAALGGMVVEGLIVSVLALLDAGRAGDGWAAVVTGGDGGAALLEGVAVDVGEVVVDLALLRCERVLKLRDVVLRVFKGNLDGDASAVVVGLVLLGVFSTGLDHLARAFSLVGNGPDVDGLLALVLDDSPAESLGESAGCESCKSGSSEDNLGMHVVYVFRLNNRIVVVQENVVKQYTRECV